jgi:hypothetical protein
MHHHFDKILDMRDFPSVFPTGSALGTWAESRILHARSAWGDDHCGKNNEALTSTSQLSVAIHPSWCFAKSDDHDDAGKQTRLPHPFVCPTRHQMQAF